MSASTSWQGHDPQPAAQPPAEAAPEGEDKPKAMFGAMFRGKEGETAFWGRASMERLNTSPRQR